MDPEDGSLDPDIVEKHNFIRADQSNLELPPKNPDFTPIGHLALDYVDSSGDLSIADRATSTMHANSFDDSATRS